MLSSRYSTMLFKYVNCRPTLGKTTYTPVWITRQSSGQSEIFSLGQQ